MSDYKSPWEEIVSEYAEAMRKREKYIVYAKSKPLGLSFGKQVICASADILDELENEIKAMEDRCNSKTKPGAKPIKIKYQRFANTSSHALSINATKHTNVYSVEGAKKRIWQELCLAEQFAEGRSKGDKEACAEEVAELREEYKKFAEFISQFGDDVAIPMGRVSGSSYKIFFFDEDEGKRKSCHLNNLVMFEQTEDEVFELAQAVQRKRRSDVKTPVYEAFGFNVYKPLSMTYKKYKELHPDLEDKKVS